MPSRRPSRHAEPPDARATSRPSQRAVPKIQRWIDLLAALLVRRYPATFAELARSVPAYSEPGRTEAALMRMFERDKDELRAFGVPIETREIETDDGPRAAYQLKHGDFYLPYLGVATPAGRDTALAPRRVDRHGYRALARLAFEPDELEAVSDAAARVRALGDPVLAAETESAVRKLALDLPLDAGASGVATLVTPATRPDAGVFAALGDALARRKRVRFAYHAMSTDREEVREVEPYGLFFVNAHWYLAGQDLARGELRNFRLGRISQAEVNASRPGTPDYTVPETFRLRDHARSRHAWELGDGDALEAIVEFRSASGAVAAAARLGAPVPGEQGRRTFQVRRLDAFARWLLSFGGDAVAVAPESLVDAYHEQVRRTLGIYDADAAAAAAAQEGA